MAAAVGISIVMSLAACGDAPDPIETGAGAGPVSTAATSPVSTEVADTTAPAETTTTIASGPTTPQPSPVDGLTSVQLRTVVEAPVRATRRNAGPVADRVTVDGRTLWRVSIPGSFDLLASRITVTVGVTDVGEGVVSPDLSRLVAVVADPSSLVAGAPVSYRWGAGDPIAAGALEVVR